MDKVKTLGNYSPSEHNASKVVDVDYSAPTVRENHGTVTAIAMPKVVGGIGEMKSNNNTQYYMQDRIYEGDAAVAIPANQSFQPYYTTNSVSNNECIQVGSLNRKGYHDFSNRVYDPNGSARTLMSDGGNNNDKAGQYLMNDLRIRKLTPTECFRLMGVKDEDSEKLANMSNSTKYHLAGDSIVTTVLMAIFGELLEIEWKEKVKHLHDTDTGTSGEDR